MVGQEILDRFPDILPREDESIFRRYVEAHQEEMDEEYDTAVESVKLSRQIEHASGNNLDRIGRIFGPVGRRTGRTDEQYRRYLKSVVQAFSGRGTDRSMREALAAALDITVEDVRLTEDFENVEYEVILHDWTPHSVNNIYEIAEIVDPSGVNQSNLRYSIPEADLQGVDEAVATDGFQVIADGFATSVDTLVQIRLQETFDGSNSADSHTDEVYVVVHSESRWDQSLWDDSDWDEKYPFERTKLRELVKEVVEADAGIDTSSSTDTTQVEADTVLWDDGNWDSMRFA